MSEEGLRYILEVGRILVREPQKDSIEKFLLEFREKFTKSLLEVDTRLWLDLLERYFSLIKKSLKIIINIMATYPQYSYKYAKLYIHALVGTIIASRKCMLVKVVKGVSRSESTINKLKCLPINDAIHLTLLDYVEPIILIDEIEIED